LKSLILLDSGVISLLASSKGGADARGCLAWFDGLDSSRIHVQVPLICYYEVRREFLRLAEDPRLDAVTNQRWRRALNWLDQFSASLGIARIDVKVVRLATALWADARRLGIPTASDDSLDADVILAAIARKAERGNRDVWVVTTNVDHLARFVQACTWDAFPLT
jgi:toxin FitB